MKYYIVHRNLEDSTILMQGTREECEKYMDEKYPREMNESILDDEPKILSERAYQIRIKRIANQ